MNIKVYTFKKLSDANIFAAPRLMQRNVLYVEVKANGMGGWAVHVTFK